MEPKSFGFPVKIQKHEWPFKPKLRREDICALLRGYFGESNLKSIDFEFFEVTRPTFGLVRSVIVLKVLIDRAIYAHYTIRVLPQPNESTKISLNLPGYQKQRIQHLVHSLGAHYPETNFIETERYMIILQEFIFHPVCEFKNPIDIFYLLRIMWFAAESRILLDYNQNHWLSSLPEKFLYYVDLDYMGDFHNNFEAALIANINQSMSFLNSQNCQFLPQTLNKIFNQGTKEEKFVNSFKKTLRFYINDCEKHELSESLQSKLKCLKKVFDP